MEYEQVLASLAPCGLDCSRCAGFKDGGIARLSRELLDQLGNYQRVAAIRAKFDPLYASYDKFEAILKELAAASCGGCRGENNLCGVPCRAKDCHREKAVDFCFQCGEFPCDQQNAIPIGERWLKMNQRMKEIGVEPFYEEQSKLPRY
jgi:hypothetical protein